MSRIRSLNMGDIVPKGGIASPAPPAASSPDPDSGAGADHPALRELTEANRLGLGNNICDAAEHIRAAEVSLYTGAAFAGALGDTSKRERFHRIARDLETLRREVVS